MLFHPLVEENKLQGNYMSYEYKYNDNTNVIKPVANMFIHDGKNINHAYEQLQLSRSPQASWDDVAPKTEVSQEVSQEEGTLGTLLIADKDILTHTDWLAKDPRLIRKDTMNLSYIKEYGK